MKRYLTKIFVINKFYYYLLSNFLLSLQHTETNEELQNPGALNSHAETNTEGKVTRKDHGTIFIHI